MATAQTEQRLSAFGAGEVAGRQRNLWVDAGRRLVRNRFAVVGLVLVGVSVGAAAALGGRWSDNIVMRLVDVAYAFPDLLLIILVQSIFGGGLWQVIVAISLVAWTGVARLVRGQMLSLRESDYAMAA